MARKKLELFWSIRKGWLSEGVLDGKTTDYLREMVSNFDNVKVLGRSYSEFIQLYFIQKGFKNRYGKPIKVSYGRKFPNFKAFVKDSGKGQHCAIIADRRIYGTPFQCFIISYNEKSMKFHISLVTKIRFKLAKLGDFKCQKIKKNQSL